jgi:hypothetical protein
LQHAVKIINANAFLVDRCQTVLIGACSFPLCTVLNEVPQGSNLGPVVFICFVNDIANCVADDVSVKLFAGNAKMNTVNTKYISSATFHSSIVHIK